jgi:hypothetical protein
MNLKKTLKGLAIMLSLTMMSLYPIFENISDGGGMSQYTNHKAFMEGHSAFFDPWQYRILCPIIAEQLFHLVDGAMLDKIYNKYKTITFTERAFDLRALQDDVLLFKYTVAFVLFRFLEHLLIYFLLYKYLGLFTKNKVLRLVFLLIASWAIANAVMNSDFSMNTYMDIIIYLLAAYVVIAKENINWLIPLSILGAMNRETAAFIPLLPFFVHLDIKNRLFPPKNIWIHTAISSILFFSILASIRLYYGYHPETHPWNLIKFNLYSATSFYTYFEVFSAIGFFPLVCLYYWRKNSRALQTFFWLIVPIWFGIHIIGTFAREARCFLMPMIVIFMPMIVEIIEQKFREENSIVP